MKIAYVFNHASFFTSHFLQIAKEIKKKNDIHLFCGRDASKIMEIFYSSKLKKNKINFTRININPTGLNFFLDLLNFIFLIRHLIKFKPDIIHCATPKGIFFGGLASLVLRTKSLVIFNSGMGFLFSNKLNFYEIIIKKTYLLILKLIICLHQNKKIIVENKSDYNFFLNYLNAKVKNLKIIYGSGVNLKLCENKYSINNNLIILPSRVVKEKGIREFCKASEIIKKKKMNWKFLVIGAIDYKKSSSFSENEIKIMEKNYNVKFLGFKKNIFSFYKRAGIVCLPSYREGLSKTLIEAAAHGIPVITTNVVGCKDAILPLKTGELCKVKNHIDLAKKILKLINNPKLRKLYSKNSKKFAKNRYNIQDVIDQNIRIYKELNGEHDITKNL